MNSLKIEKFIGLTYDGVFKNVSSNLCCETRRDYGNFAFYLPGSVSNCTNFNGSRSHELRTLVRKHSPVLPGALARHYSSGHDDHFPQLTRMKCKGYPTSFASFSNFFLTYLVIKPHLDLSFSTDEFLYTTKKVVEVVSNKIAESDTEALNGLVTSDVLEEIKINLPKFAVSQRQDLAFTQEELVYSFLDTITLNVDNEHKTKSLEILTIHHAFKGIEVVKKMAENFNPFNMEAVQEEISKNKPRPFVLNYRFSRKFNESGDPDDWVINGLQHRSGKSFKMLEFF